VIPGFRHGVNEVSALLGCNTALIGSWLLTFQGSLRSHLRGSGGQRRHLKMGLMACPKMSVTNYGSRANGFSLRCLSRLSQ